MCSRDERPCEVCAECIATLEPDRPIQAFDRPWTPTADEERIASMYPSFAILAYMHPLDRAWFTQGDRGWWVRRNFAGILPLWAWVVLGGSPP